MLKNPLNLFLVFYVAIYVLFPSYDTGINSASRLATMASMVENRSFSINDYAPAESTIFHWTGDWSRTPDGTYYSNKAPGPMLLAYPVYWVLDKILTRSASTKDERNSIRYAQRLLVSHILAMLFQVLPFAYFAGLMIVDFGSDLNSRPSQNSQPSLPCALGPRPQFL